MLPVGFLLVDPAEPKVMLERKPGWITLLITCRLLVCYVQQQQQPFYGPLSGTTPGEPVPEETLTHPPS